MEYIPKKYQNLFQTTIKSFIPYDWLQDYLTQLYTSNTNYKEIYIACIAYDLLTKKDIDIYIAISDILMDYIIEADKTHIEKIDSYITEYRNQLRYVYMYAKIYPDQKLKIESILNISKK